MKPFLSLHQSLETSPCSHPSIPAYERFSPLAASTELPLPMKYQQLLEQYKHLDFLVCHMHNKGGISTFEKLQPVMQQKTKRYSISMFISRESLVSSIVEISPWKLSVESRQFAQ